MSRKRGAHYVCIQQMRKLEHREGAELAHRHTVSGSARLTSVIEGALLWNQSLGFQP